MYLRRPKFLIASKICFVILIAGSIQSFEVGCGKAETKSDSTQTDAAKPVEPVTQIPVIATADQMAALADSVQNSIENLDREIKSLVRLSDSLPTRLTGLIRYASERGEVVIAVYGSSGFKSYSNAVQALTTLQSDAVIARLKNLSERGKSLSAETGELQAAIRTLLASTAPSDLERQQLVLRRVQVSQRIADFSTSINSGADYIDATYAALKVAVSKLSHEQWKAQ